MKNLALRNFFSAGFLLSVPTAIFVTSAFSGSPGNGSLIILLIIGLLTLPGSFVLLTVGFISAFSGKTGELIAITCLALSIPNAHIMGMIYARAHEKRKQSIKIKKHIPVRECPKCQSSINSQSLICKYCHATIEPIYVNNPQANQQVIKILKLRSSGLKYAEIAKILNNDGDTFLEDNSSWDVKKISSLISKIRKTYNIA